MGIQLTKNFNINEFKCKDGSDEVIVDPELVELLQILRDRINKPIVIVSGYRTKEYNKKIKGAPNSYHLKGQAADIRVEGVDPKIMAIHAAKVGFRGIGVYNNFIHVDVRQKEYFWKGE